MYCQRQSIRERRSAKENHCLCVYHLRLLYICRCFIQISGRWQIFFFSFRRNVPLQRSGSVKVQRFLNLINSLFCMLPLHIFHFASIDTSTFRPSSSRKSFLWYSKTFFSIFRIKFGSWKLYLTETSWPAMEGVRNHLDQTAIHYRSFELQNKKWKRSQFNQICPLVSKLKKVFIVFNDCIPSTCQLRFTHPFE